MLLQTMLDDMASAPAIYQPTRFWASCVPHIVEDIKKQGIENFRSHASGLAYYVPSYASIEYLQKKEAYEAEFNRLAKADANLGRLWRADVNGQNQALLDYRIVVAADDGKAPELMHLEQSTVGNPAEAFKIDGKIFGAAFLRYMKCLAFLKKTVAAHRIRRVLEIGGGYGVMGEILGKQSRPYFYMNVDIPPVAYVATYYLKQVLGEDAVFDYAQAREMDRIDPAELQKQGYKAAVLCPWQLEKVTGSFEMFFNSASFQEMEPEVVENYARDVSRLVTHFLVLKNSRHGKQLASENKIGVEKPTKHEDYLRFFADFKMIACDAATFGIQSDTGFASDVMIFSRK